MIQEIELESAPTEEKCIQVGSVNYYENAREECKRFISLLKKKFPNIPKNVQYKIKSNPHDFGSYLNVSIKFDDNDEKAIEYACNVENNLPKTWNDV